MEFMRRYKLLFTYLLLFLCKSCDAVDCSGTHLVFSHLSTQPNCRYAPNAESIKLDGVSWVELSNWFQPFPNLRELDLNYILQINDLSLEHTPKLEKLRIAGAAFKSLDPSIIEHPSLRVLRLIDLQQLERLESIHSPIRHLTLEGSPLLSELPPQLSGAKLDHLSLRNNGIRSIGEEITSQGELTFLDLSNNPIQQMPNTISRLKQLVTLTLNHTSIRALPAGINDLQMLLELELENVHELTYIPPLDGMQNLSTLSIKVAPQLSQLSIDHLDSLLLLELTGSGLTASPKIGLAPRLERLKLRYNQGLTELNLAASHVPNLRYLHLDQNALRHISGLEGISHLQGLFLEDNQMQLIPESTCQLEQLEELRLSHNSLRQLCDLSTLKKLRALTINNNNFSHLPEDLDKISALKFLDIREIGHHVHEHQLRLTLGDHYSERIHVVLD